MEDFDFKKYFAGFFDADGSVFWSRKNIHLNISQSEKTILDYMNKKYNNLFKLRCYKRSIKRTQFQLTSCGVALYPVLVDLEKYSIIKNPQIKKAIEFIHIMNRRGEQEERNDIGKIIKKMNHEHYNEEYIMLRPYEKLSIQYIAGLFDGDGCVCIRTDLGKYAKITQKNDTLMLEKIHQLYPGSRFKKGDVAVVFERTEVMMVFLNDILPFLIYKKEQVIDTIKFLETDNKEEKTQLAIKIKNAKKFDLDPEKYKQELEYIFKDLDENYTKEELMLGKKFTELQHTRKNLSLDKKIFPGNHLDIKPKIIFCESRQENETWLYLRKKTSSIYHTGSIGRSVRILVVDEVSGFYLGVMSLGSDFYNIKARDEYIKKFTDKNISDYLIYIANLNCCVPLQPFGYNTNGAKLLLKLAFSKEVSEYWFKKYNTPLLGICTLGVNGKSIAYSRLKEVKQVGYTKGKCSTLHIPVKVVEKARVLYRHLNLTNVRHGTVDMLRTLFNKVKINTTFDKHINNKSVYFGFLYDTKFDETKVNTSLLKSVEELSVEWKTRWANNRFTHLEKTNRIKTKIELYDYNDEIFKNIKHYILPESRNIQKIQPVETKTFVKTEPTEKKILILERLDNKKLIELMTKKGILKTQEASDEIKQKYNIIIQRSQISKLWIGEIIPDQVVINSEEYKKALVLNIKRKLTNEKTEKWKEAIKIGNSKKRKLTDEQMVEIMKEKKTAHSSKEVGEKYDISRQRIDDIWNGKVLPIDITFVTQQYKELVTFKRTDTNK